MESYQRNPQQLEKYQSRVPQPCLQRDPLKYDEHGKIQPPNSSPATTNLAGMAAQPAGFVPSSNLAGMQQQSMGFVRAPPPSVNVSGMAAQSMGFVPPPPPPTNSESQWVGIVPLPPPSANLPGMMSQSVGYQRPPNVPSNNLAGMNMQQTPGYVVSANVRGVTSREGSGRTRHADLAGLSNIAPGFARHADIVATSNFSPGYARSQHEDLDDTRNDPGYEPRVRGDRSRFPPRDRDRSASEDFRKRRTLLESVDSVILNAEIDFPTHTSRTSFEIQQELKQLFEVVKNGFIQEAEYERRKQILEHEAEKAFQPSYPLVTAPPRFALSHAHSASLEAEQMKPRAVRVFLSSTFLDMQRERDALVKRTFPLLKKQCAERGIFFSEIDLRWGITAEQSERGEVLELCLREIDQCRPYFINFLGTRYGYVPQKIPSALREKYPWLPDTDRGGNNTKSVTELEIMHGALNNPSEASFAHFYLRNDSQEELSKQPAALAALKDRVKTSGLPVRMYTTPEELAELVLDDLTRAIATDFPRHLDPDAFQMEEYAQRSYADSKCRIYVPDEHAAYYTKLDSFVENSKSPFLCVSGVPGSGKSSLLATWCSKRRSDGKSGDIIAHYVGASSQSADYLQMIKRIVTSFVKMYGIEEKLPDDARELGRQMNRWVKLIPQASQLVIVIDAVNQLVDADGCLELRWLPDEKEVPQNVKFVLSSAAGHRTNDLMRNQKKFALLELSEMPRANREQLIRKYLAQFGKSFDTTQLSKIVNASQTGNPLYLKVLLEELRVLGVYEALNSKINDCLACFGVSDLYLHIISRLAADFGQPLVRDVFSLVHLSRRGLSEDEIMELSGANRMSFSPLYLAIREFFIVRDGLLKFANDYIGDAVDQLYSPGAAERNRLATYFAKSQNPMRKADEWPFHLWQVSDYEGVRAALSDLPVFLALYNKRRKYELLGDWLRLKQLIPGLNVGECFESSVSQFKRTERPTADRLAKVLSYVARFLREIQYFAVAENLFKQALAFAEPVFGEVSSQVGKLQYLLAECLWNQGKMDEALPYCEKSLEIRERVFGSHHLHVAMSLCGLGELLIEKDGPRARSILQRALAIRTAHFGDAHPLVARCLQDLAVIADNEGRSDEAVELCLRAIRVREKALGGNHPHLGASLETLGSIYFLRKEYTKAEEVLRRGLSIFRAVHGDHHTSVQSSLEWLVHVMKALNRLDEANKLSAEAKAIAEVLKANNVSLSERIAD